MDRHVDFVKMVARLDMDMVGRNPEDDQDSLLSLIDKARQIRAHDLLGESAERKEGKAEG